MKIIDILLLLLLLLNSFSTTRIDTLFEKLREYRGEIGEFLDIITYIRKSLNFYAFYSISQWPPQPSFDSSYFPPHDVYSALSDVKTSSTYEYELNRQISIAIGKLRDFHISVYSRLNNINYIYVSSPVKLSVSTKSGQPKMYATSNINNASIYENGQEALDIITKNVDVPIKTINGKSPFVFVEEFGGEVSRSHNPHSTYTRNFDLIERFDLRHFYLSKEELNNLEVTYENGDSFKTCFGINDLKGSIFTKTKVFEDDKTNDLFIEYLDKKEEKKYFNAVNNQNNHEKLMSYIPKINSLKDDIENFKRQNNITAFTIMEKMNINKYKSESTNNETKKIISWDYICKDNENKLSFKCRVDSENKLNVVLLYSFSADGNKVSKIFGKCLTEFDKNDYKIVVILSRNPGGYISSAQMMIEGIQPHIDVELYTSIQNSGYLDKYDSHNLFENLLTLNSERVTVDYLEENMITIQYGSHSIETSEALILNENKNLINNMRNILNKKRTPTEIIVYTDAYSYGAAGVFCKTLQNYGGAILVGYHGNPTSKKVFDSGQSLSTTIGYLMIDTLMKKEKKKRDKDYDNDYEEKDLKRGRTFIVEESFLPLFSKYNDLHTPMEYEINEVDERVDIYHRYSDSTYDEFMSKANEIFKKYETSCSGKNKKLTKFSDSCTFSDDSNARGGYTCENGKWSKKCEKIYCVSGFLDIVTNKCSNGTTIRETPGKKSDDSYGVSTGAIVAIIILTVLIVAAIVIIIICCLSTRKNITYNNNSTTNYDINNTKSLSSQCQSVMVQQTQGNINKTNMMQNMNINNPLQQKTIVPTLNCKK